MTKMGFYFDQTACAGCKTCQIACKDKNDLPIGVTFRTISEYETGSYPATKIYKYSGSCNHCVDPACVANCPTGAAWKDEEDGTVQIHESICIGCETCVHSCPYGVPKYIESAGVVRKCNACKELRANGEQPACVASCLMRALEFGPIEELEKKHPNAVRDIAPLPDSSITNPCTLIEARPWASNADYKKVML